MNTEFVIVHPVEGIYLGCCLGLGFWTNLDPAGQPAATTFTSVEEAQQHINSWKSNPDYPKAMIPDLKIMPVRVNESGFATIEECVAAGLPAWNPEPEGERAFAE